MKRRTSEERKAYFDGFNTACELTARRLEEANDETSRECIAKAIRDMKQTDVLMDETL